MFPLTKLQGAATLQLLMKKLKNIKHRTLRLLSTMTFNLRPSIGFSPFSSVVFVLGQHLLRTSLARRKHLGSTGLDDASK